MLAAKERTTFIPSLAACALARLSENPHRGFRLPTAALYQSEALANSNTASGLRACSYDFGRRSRSTGKLRDNESGLDFFGARYFSGAQGRFTSPDWSAKPQPVPYADLTDPQTLNQYAYVRDNPLRSADPNGHENPSSYYGPLEDQVQNAPMSDTEKHVDAAILAGSSAFATGGLTLEAMAAGEIIASITGTMAAGASVVATGYETTAAIAHISSEQSEKVTTALGAMSTPAGILTTAVTRSPTLGAAASDVQNAATAAAKLKDAAKDPAGTVMTTTGLIQDVKSMLTSPPPPPPPPSPPPPRMCGSNPCH